MIKLQDLSYVRLGTTDLDGATKFATDYLGLEIAHRLKDSVADAENAHICRIDHVRDPLEAL